MSVTIGELLVSLRASTAAFAKDLDKAQQLSFNTSREIQRSFEILGTLAAGALTAATGAVTALTVRSIESAAAMGRLAEKTGTSVEQFSGLAFAAEQNSVSTEALSKALVALSKNLEKSNQQTNEGKAAHSALGVLFRGNIPVFKDTDDAFTQIAQRLATLPDLTERTALAAQVLGKTGAQLIPLLIEGAGGLEEFKKKAKELGVEIDTNTAKEAERFEQNIKTLHSAVEGLSNEMAKKLLPTFVTLSQVAAGAAKSDWIKELKEGVKSLTNSFLTNSFDPLADQLIRLHAAGATAAIELNKDKDSAAAAAAAVEAAAKAHAKLVDAIDGTVKKLKEKIATVGLTNAQVELYRLSVLGATEAELRHVQSLNTEANFYEAANKKIYASIHLTDEYHQTVSQQIEDQKKVAELADKAATAALTASLGVGKSLQDVLARGIGGSEDLTGHFEAMKPKLSALGEAAQGFGEHMGQAFESAIIHGKSFSDVMQQLLRDFEAAILKATVWASLFQATKNLTGIGGFFGSIFKGLAGRAGGGPVSAGTPYMVGERGPEIFYPAVSGTIAPNGGGGASVTNNYIDARGADPTVEFRIRRAIAESENRAVAKAVVAVREMNLRTT